MMDPELYSVVLPPNPFKATLCRYTELSQEEEMPLPRSKYLGIRICPQNHYYNLPVVTSQGDDWIRAANVLKEYLDQQGLQYDNGTVYGLAFSDNRRQVMFRSLVEEKEA